MLFTFGAIAAEPTSAPPGVAVSTMIQTFVGLALILGLFIGAAWLLRRMNGGRSFMAPNSPLRIISSLPVGARERIILLEVEETWLVIGVAPGEIRTLHTLPKGTLPPGSQDNRQFGQFGEWLKKFREERNDAKH